MSTNNATIANLPESISRMSEFDKILLDKLFDIRIAYGKLIYPDSPEIIKNYGAKEEVINQKIIKIINRFTFEGAIFNELRSRRPIQTKEQINLDDEMANFSNCIFCIPKVYYVTAEDTFIDHGRINRDTCLTASNSGKFDEYHGLVIFKDHNPFSFGNFPDYLDCAIEWAKLAQEKDNAAINFFFMWNCLWKAGGSIIHGHTQMSLTKGLHYGKIEYLLNVARNYDGNYFRDLFNVHKALGLGFEIEGAKIMAYLTPIKEKEVIICADTIDAIKIIIPKLLSCYYANLGVRSFNLVFICPPAHIFSNISEADRSKWNDFPLIARLVDRGDLNNRTTDFGAMELYANSIISNDPFTVANLLKKGLGFHDK